MRQPRFIDDALAALEVDLARFGQFDLAGRAMQQPQADGLFQRGDPA